MIKAIKARKARFKYLSYVLSVCVCGFLMSVSVCGLDRDRPITQFYHTSWTVKEGAPSQINALAQTNDGYLWLGTATGLYRFDGVLFEHYMPLSGGAFPSKNIYSLFASPEGGLWIGFRYGGVSFLNDGQLTNYSESEGLPPGRVQSFANDNDGTIWMAAAGGLARFDGARWQQIDMEWSYPGKAAQAVFVDRAGTLWVATEETIVFLPKGANSFQSTGTQIIQVMQITQSSDGVIWMAETTRSVHSLILLGTNPRSVGPEIHVGSAGFTFDREGALWVTTLGDGIRRMPFTDRFRGQTITEFGTEAEIFTEKEGLSSDFARPILEDREGNIWVGTGNGLDRFRESSLVPIRFPPGYQNFGMAAGERGEVWTISTNRPANRIRGATPTEVGPNATFFSLFRDDEGAIWMAVGAEIGRFKADKYKSIETPNSFKDLMVQTIFKDRGGVLWVYLDPIGIFQLKNGVWAPYDRQSELPKSIPITGSIDSLDRKWFGYARNVLSLIDGDKIRTFSRDDGLEVGDVKAITEISQRLWVGGEFGLAFFDGERFRLVNAAGGETFNGVSGIVEASDGAIWINESRGIVYIPSAEIRLALENPAYTVQYRLFDFLDGLLGDTQQNKPFPTAIKGSDGRLWFSTNKGVVWINPARLSTNTVPPPVSIKSLSIDEQKYELSESLQLPQGTTSLRFDYTALSLSVPERVRFKYQLEGVDKLWQDAGTRREAFYTNLGPGNYQFRVIACNQDGIWNETGATLKFTIQPTFYQTLWFRLGSILLALLLVGVILRTLYNRRISQTTRRLNAQFDERLAERTRISHELHDTLLQGFLGVTMRLQAISNLLPTKSKKAKENLDEVLNKVDIVLEEGRRAIWNIKSSTFFVGNDLIQAFTRFGEDLNKTYPTNFSLTIEGENCPLHPLVRDEVYRIGREALINAFRHSKANKIEMGIEYSPKHLRIFINDNGCGISEDYLSAGREGHLGLSGMREYAEKISAELKIWSREENGTEVELIVPRQIAYMKKSSNSSLKRLSRLFRRKSESNRQNDQGH